MLNHHYQIHNILSKPTIHRLGACGVGSILDYAVEEDLDSEEAVSLEMESCTGDEGAYADRTSQLVIYN